MKFFYQLLTMISAMTCIAFQGNAQQLKGYIKDQNQNPIGFASVIISKDSSLSEVVMSTVSDDSGFYKIDKLSAGNYFLTARFVGYKTIFQKIQLGADPLLLPLTLVDTSSQLGDVVVQSRRPVFKKEVDKFVFNVENSSVTVGGNSYDVLKHTPLLIADNDGNLKIASMASNATVYINGRKSYLTGTDLVDFLKAMPASNIVKVEIVTLPSAKYEAANTGGVINIILKKNYNEGLNGSVTLSGTKHKYQEGQGSLLLNYRKGNYSQQFQGSYYDGKDYNYLNLTNVYPQVNQTEKMITDNISRAKSINLRTSVDYQLAKKSTIGGSVSYQHLKKPESTSSLDYIIYPTYTDSLLNLANSPYSKNFASGNLYYQFKDDANQRTLDFNLDGFLYNTHSQSDFNSYYLNNRNDIFNGYQSDGKQKIKNYSFKLDYSQPIFADINLEAGGKYTFTETRNPYNFYNLDTLTNQHIFNPGVSNYFIYREKIAAAYLSLQKQITDKFSAKVGMRVEKTKIENIQRTLNETHLQDYTRWLPTAFLSYNFNKNHSLSFAVKSDMNRPSYWEMNPFVNYISNKVAEQGNPFLTPSKSVRGELSYVFHSNYVFMASYTKETNLFQQVIQVVPPDTLFYKRANYGYQKNFSLVSVISQNVIKNHWNFTLTNSITWYKMNVTANGEDYVYKYPQYAVSMQNNFTNIAGTGIDGTLTGQYFSKFAQANMIGKSVKSMDFGFSKYFSKSDLRLALAVEDLFYSHYYRIHSFASTQMMNAVTSKDNTRLVRLSIVKSFGNHKMKRFQSNSNGNSEEKNRL